MAHHGIARNPRLNRLMKKRSRVAADGGHAETPCSTTYGSRDGSPQSTARGVVQHEVVVPVLEKRQSTPKPIPEDMTKVMATVVNVIDDDSKTLSESVGLTLGPVTSLLDGTTTATPAYSLLTADTPSLTSSQTSTASATTSAYTSALTSRPLINSSSAPASTSSVPSPSSRSGLFGSASSSTSSGSQVTRSSTSSSLTTSSTSSVVSSISSSTTSTTSSDSSTITGVINGFGGGGSTGTAQGPTGPMSTNSNSSPGPGPGVPPTTQKIVGGVVGSVAGAVMLVILALLLLHRRRVMRKSPEGLPSSEGAGAGAAGGQGPVSQPGEMNSRWSSGNPLFAASYFAPAFMKPWRQSTQTTRTEDTLIGSERGFQKVSGRKIPSVLTSGGDGYGGGYETGSPTISEQSMTAPPASPVIPRSPASQPPPPTRFGMPLDVNYTREAEESNPGMFIRSSPARKPVASTASITSVSAPINIPRVPSRSRGALSPAVPTRPDTLGRSHPSFDGSRGSRFTESL